MTICRFTIFIRQIFTIDIIITRYSRYYQIYFNICKLPEKSIDISGRAGTWSGCRRESSAKSSLRHWGRIASGSDEFGGRCCYGSILVLEFDGGRASHLNSGPGRVLSQFYCKFQSKSETHIGVFAV